MTVNVYTEWSELKEVIVGSVYNITDHNVDLSFKLFFDDNIRDVLLKNSLPLKTKLIQERQDDLDSLAHTLESLNIKVYRPDKLEYISKFKTPHFEDNLSPCDNPRDQVLIYGNSIIETPTIWRKRYFENQLLQSIFQEKFSNGARWISAPKPLMRDVSYDLEYARKNKNINIDWTLYDKSSRNFEIMFDAAQCLKFGKDIIMNVSNQNHELGYKWLKSILPESTRLHKVSFCDHHIDSMMMPLAPGKLLISSGKMENLIEQLPNGLQKWDRLIVPVKNKADYDTNLASGSINTNIFPIGSNKVITFNETFELEPEYRKLLEENHFEVIHVRLRHSRLFGGGVHCATLDLVREDSNQDFFN